MGIFPKYIGMNILKKNIWNHQPDDTRKGVDFYVKSR